MRPRIYIVSDKPKQIRHRAFSLKQAAFCGRVPALPDHWLCSHMANSPGRDCRACCKSPLNGEVVLRNDHYVPAATTMFRLLVISRDEGEQFYAREDQRYDEMKDLEGDTDERH
jgi:hypothetical protein